MVDIGTRRGRGRIKLTDAERAYHLHVLGATGTGKSKLLEHMIRQDVAGGRGLCLIDPHGTLSDEIEKWCAARGLSKVRHIHLIKPGDNHFTPGFNPLRLSQGEAPAVRVDAMVSACAQVWGGQDMSATPRLKKILRALFFVLAVRELTIADALFFLRSGDPDGTRRALTTDLPDPIFDFVWGELNTLSRKDFAEYTESTISRLTEFLSSPAVRLMIGQRQSALDFRAVMDAGDIVLVNLGSRATFSYENARVVGSLIINDLFLTALGRDTRVAKRKPFTLYIDEAHDFLSNDVERILDQTRKFGLHAVLAHQRLGQLKERGEGVYNAVMTNARTKIVFGGLADDDAGVMAREILRSEVNLEVPKHILDKPVVVDEIPYWFESGGWSESESSSTSVSTSSGWSETAGVSASDVQSFDMRNQGFGGGFGAMGLPTSISMGGGNSSSTTMIGGESVTDSMSRSRSEQRSWVEGRVNVRAYLPTSVYSLEEQLHLGQLKLRNLQDQHAIVKRSGKPAEEVRIANVAAPLSSMTMIERFRDVVCTSSIYVSSTEAAQSELSKRQSTISTSQKTAVTDTDFWSN